MTGSPSEYLVSIDVEISRSRSPGNLTGPCMKEFDKEIMAESARADGIVVNSFDDLEFIKVRRCL